jgi:putative membrane protein
MRDDTEHKLADAQLDHGTRLAFERTYLAHERTQMAWVRTSVALITLGFATAKFGHWLHEQRPERTPLVPPGTVGTLMIVLGLVSLALASIEHGRSLRVLRAQCPGLRPSLAWVLATLLALLGVLALVVVLLRE